jgi:transposase
MDYHQNARTMLWSREAMARMVVEQGFTLKLAAASFKVSAKTAAKWVRRYREHGLAGLVDRSSRPRRLYRPTSQDLVSRVEVLRRERWTGFRIARATGLSGATVSRILCRLKLNRMRDLEPAPVVVRYEHASPGDLLHLDIKRLVRIARPSHRVTGNRRDKVPGIGAEFVHIAIVLSLP